MTAKPSPKPLWAASIAALLFLAACLHSLLYYHPEVQGCGKVWMYPSYTKLKGFDTAHTRLGDKYGLYLYRDDYYQKLSQEFKPVGIPVIFIPGNAGSYKQARSIGSLAAEAITERNLDQEQRLDLYTIDFEEDFSAFHGRTLLDQAEYVNDAIRFILALYDQENQATPHPKSVIVIGHSMGGFIARTLVGLGNYVPESVNTIITLASPHARPPIAFDAELTNVYEIVNKYWSQAYSTDMIGRSPLSSVALVSIAGGKPDTMVPSEYASVTGLTTPSHGFATFSYSMPNVWTSIDHLAMVWCHQARAAIVNALLSITDARSPGKTKSLESRMQVFSKYFLSGFEPYQYNRFVERGQRLKTLKQGSKEWDAEFPLTEKLQVPAQKVRFPQGTFADTSDINLFALPSEYNADDLVQIMLNDTASVDVLLCKQANLDELEDVSMDCYNTEIDEIPVPYSSPHHNHASLSGYRMKDTTVSASYIEYNITRDLGDRFTHIAIRPRAETGFVVVNPRVTTPAITVSAGFFNLLFGSIQVKLPHSRTRDISLKGASNPLLSYAVTIEQKGSNIDGMPAPMVRQYVLDPFESKFHTNVGTGARTARVSFHGLAAPYVPHTVDTDNGATNLHLQVFLPPLADDGTFYVNIKLDLWASLANLIPRYRTVLIPFAVAAVVSVCLVQVHMYSISGRVVSFADGAKVLIKGFLPIGVPVLILLQVLLSFSPIRSLAGLLESPLSVLGGPSTKLASLGGSSSNSVNGLLVGVSGFDTLLLTPLLVFLALGVTTLVYQLVVGSMNFIVARTAKASSRIETLDQSRDIMPGPTFLVLALGALGLTYFYAPYPLVFTILVVYEIGILGYAKHQSLVYPKTTLPTTVNILESVVMLLLWTVPLGVPVVIAWVHTLIEYSFAEPCSSHRSPLALLPILLLAYVTHRAVVSPDSPKRVSVFLSAHQGVISSLLTVLKALLGYTCAYALIAGFRKTYFLFQLTNLISFFVAGAYMWSCYVDRLTPAK